MQKRVKLIFACDVSELGLGKTLINKTASHIDTVKVGLEAYTAEDAVGVTLGRHLRHYAANIHDLDVMEDWKLHDVSNTMAKAAQNIVARRSSLFTLHASASDAALEAVAKAAEGTEVMPLAVTVLTDLDESQCQSRFAYSSGSTVVAFAKNAHSLGIRGFVCSPHEAQLIREVLPEAYIVTPGIRPLWAVAKDEQKRVTTPTQAKRAGVDAIVVGRPISKPPPSHTETQAALEIRQELDAA